MDLRVDSAVMFGLADTAESLVQEGGRVMRGSSLETSGKQGYAFFFQKGHLGTLAFPIDLKRTKIVGIVCKGKGV